MTNQINGTSNVCSAACSGWQQRKNIKALLYGSFARGIHQSLVHSPHKRPVMQKEFSMSCINCTLESYGICMADALLYWPFVRRINRWLVHSPHKEPVMWKTMVLSLLMHWRYHSLASQPSIWSWVASILHQPIPMRVMERSVNRSELDVVRDVRTYNVFIV